MLRNLTYSANGLISTEELATRLRTATRGIRYDTIIGTGVSGALVVPAVGRAIRKHWALIRKDRDSIHAAGVHFEGEIGERFIIVDDFVRTGATIANILRKVTVAHGEYLTRLPKPEFVGVWQYDRRPGEDFLPSDNSFSDKWVEAVREYNPQPAPPPQRFPMCTCDFCTDAQDDRS
jgi:hypothetical protein